MSDFEKKLNNTQLALYKLCVIAFEKANKKKFKTLSDDEVQEFNDAFLANCIKFHLI